MFQKILYLRLINYLTPKSKKMKNFFLLVAFITCFAFTMNAQTTPGKKDAKITFTARPTTATQHVKKDGSADKRFKENRHHKKDGTLDRRYKGNGHHKRNGTPDKRFKENRHHKNNGTPDKRFKEYKKH
jgi:hypothetical protein